MKTNYLICGLIVIGLVIMAGLGLVAGAFWCDNYHQPAKVKPAPMVEKIKAKTPLTFPVSEIKMAKPVEKPVAVETAKAPVAPESEVDRKLRKLGFGPSTEVHRISVSQ